MAQQVLSAQVAIPAQQTEDGLAGTQVRCTRNAEISGLLFQVVADEMRTLNVGRADPTTCMAWPLEPATVLSSRGRGHHHVEIASQVTVKGWHEQASLHDQRDSFFARPANTSAHVRQDALGLGHQGGNGVCGVDSVGKQQGAFSG